MRRLRAAFAPTLDEKIAEWLRWDQGGAAMLAWAVGYVNLWGRVNECELGWRGEHAYPYAITLHSADEALAFELRRLYRVDVDLAPPLVREPREQRSVDELRDRLAALRDEFDELTEEVESADSETGDEASARASREGYRFLPDLLARDDVMAALRKVLEQSGEEWTLATVLLGKLAEGDPKLPVWSSPVGVAHKLSELRLRGEVAQIRKGKCSLSRWGLADATIPDGWHVVTNPRDELATRLLGALERRGGTALTVEFAEDVGMTTRAEKGTVGYALAEFTRAGRLNEVGRAVDGARKSRWSLFAPSGGGS